MNSKNGPISEAAPTLTGGPPAGSPDETSTIGQGDWDVFASLPKIGLYRTEDHQYYHNGFGPYPSVTTVMRVVNKWALNNYRERAVGRYAFQWPQLAETDIEEGISRAQALVDADRDLAGTFGTSVHTLAEALGADERALEGFPLSETQKDYAAAFSRFLGHLRGSGGEIASSEKAVLSMVNGYAGTYDLILQWKCPAHSSCLWLVDIKTYKSGPFPEDAWQLAGYMNAEYVVLPGNPTKYPLPQIDHGAILHVRPDKYADPGWALYEYAGIGNKEFLAFLACLEIWQWQQEGRFTRSNIQKAMVQGT